MNMGRKLTVLWDERELGNSVMLFTWFCCRCCPSQRALPTQCPTGHLVLRDTSHKTLSGPDQKLDVTNFFMVNDNVKVSQQMQNLNQSHLAESIVKIEKLHLCVPRQDFCSKRCHVYFQCSLDQIF